jgi:hypothetical protein
VEKKKNRRRGSLKKFKGKKEDESRKEYERAVGKKR